MIRIFKIKIQRFYIPQGLDLRRVKVALNHIAMKRMGRMHETKKNLKFPASFSGIKGIVDTKSLHCLTLNAHPRNRWSCIKCKLGEAQNHPRIVINLSRYFAMILTNSAVDHRCNRCRTIETLGPKECVNYLNGHSMEMNFILRRQLHSIPTS